MTEEEKGLETENLEQEEQAEGNSAEAEQEAAGSTDSTQTEDPSGEASEIETLKAKLDEEETRRLRMHADFENYKRRANLDREAAEKYKAQSLMVNLLPVLDNFERALSVEVKSEESQSLLTGMEMIHRSLLEAMKSEGLVEIEAEGKEFDPNFHQAVMTGQDEEKPSGTVLDELQKGYMLKDRVLRPSMVKVNE